jgi:hypothetical protein
MTWQEEAVDPISLLHQEVTNIMSKKSAGLIMAGVLLLGSQAWAAQAEGQASGTSSTATTKHATHTKHSTHTKRTTHHRKGGETKPTESTPPSQ